MQTKVATKINELNQQVTHLQDENEKLHSLTTGAAKKPSHESDEEFRSSVEYQKDVDQPVQLLKKLRELESELESTKSTLEDERKKHKEKLKELKAQASHQQSTNQVKLHASLVYIIHMCMAIVDKPEKIIWISLSMVRRD